MAAERLAEYLDHRNLAACHVPDCLEKWLLASGVDIGSSEQEIRSSVTHSIPAQIQQSHGGLTACFAFAHAVSAVSSYFTLGGTTLDRFRRLAALILASSVFTAFAPIAISQQVDPQLLQSLHWRGIGPYRGGRTKAAAGVPSQPNVFYIGVCNGGVWKTNDYGRTWNPIFDQQPTGSIGAVAVSISDPNVVYVGSGEGLQRPDLSVGDGIYKSTDAGKTWTHLGLRDGQQIPQIAIDPRDPNKLLSRLPDIPMDRTKSAASSAPPTAARPSRKSYIRMKT